MSTNKVAHACLALVIIFAGRGALAANTTSTTKSAISDYTRPLSFEPNRGQTDQGGDFIAHGLAYGLFLSHGRATLALKGGESVRMKPVGANASASAEALERQSSKSNYFIGNVPERWHTSIPNYAKVRYRGVYPGIDLIYYGNQQQLEYDFVLSPGADPSSILLDFQGAAKAALDPSGELVMHTPTADLRWHKPVAYQEINGERKLIACSYARKSGDRLSFTLAAYDRTKPLIIDPVLRYSTYLGGTGATFNEGHEGGGDLGSGIAVDLNGNAYVVGTALSTDFPTKNPFQKKSRSRCCTSAFVTKFDTTGKLVYSTYLGGSGFVGPDATFEGDSGLGIAVDRLGNAYVTGSSGSLDFPLKNAFQRQNYNSATSSCCHASRRSSPSSMPAGSGLVFSTYLGGHGFLAGESGNGIAVDAHENAYVTGFTDSSDFPTKNAFQKTLEGGLGSRNAFVTKFNAAGCALVYSTFLAGNNGGNGIAIDAKGNAYITGSTSSPDLPTKNAFQDTLKGFQDAFVTKFDAAGNELVYSTYLGGGGDQANSIAVDAAGHAYVTGFTNSTDFPIKNAFQKKLKSLTNTNAFVTKIGAAGNALVYSTYLGGSNGSNGDGGSGIAVDVHSNAFVTGFTSSTDFPAKNALQNAFAGGFSDAFITEIDAADCALVYSTYLGGNSGDGGNGIAVDANGNAYIVGATSSTDFPMKDAFQDKLKSGANNAFVTKISAH